MHVQYEWDREKAASNLEKHGVAFEAIHDFDWQAAIGVEDPRGYGGEVRFIAFAPIGPRLHHCASSGAAGSAGPLACGIYEDTRNA